MDLATSGKGGRGTFVGICIISAAFGVADGFVQGGMVGDLSYMAPEFVQSFLAGLAASGLLTSALRMITKAAFENSKNGLRKGAIMFFTVSALFELLCVLLYAYVFPKLPIIKYYRSKAASQGSKTVSADLAAGGITTQPGQEDKLQNRLSTKALLMENKDYALDIFLIYLLTLSIFPGFLSEDSGKHCLGAWYALVLIAMFNGADLIGRYIPLLNPVKLESRRGLMMTILARTKALLMENKDYALDIFLIYLLTLSIFPGFLSEDTGKHSLGAWYALVLIAMFNGADLIGRYIPLLNPVKLESRRGLMMTILARFLLIPAFYFTAKYGGQGWMILLTCFLGLSNGYLTVCVLTSAPKGYMGPEQNALGNVLVFFLSSGIFAGVTADWLWLIGKGW
uniref:Equilibrative nucleoside transporter n=1 Tax=Kalanchoe fedtschenkoi TaxID=63787 RepID=A0A7N0VCN9_KALFE